AFDQGCKQLLAVLEILIERAHADARPFGDVIGGSLRPAVFRHGASSGLDQRLHGLPRALLGRRLFHWWQCELKANKYSHNPCLSQGSLGCRSKSIFPSPKTSPAPLPAMASRSNGPGRSARD